MDVFGSIEGYAVEEGDYIVIDGQQIEVRSVIDNKDTITVKGYSETTGDIEEFEIDPFAEYEIWGA